jgi:hypothetical protein
MNERIKELSKEAGLVADATYAKAPDAIWLKEYNKKFAELIVGECLKIAKNREDELESAGLLEESNAVGIVAYRISRQFGVKR